MMEIQHKLLQEPVGFKNLSVFTQSFAVFASLSSLSLTCRAINVSWVAVV